MYYYSDEKNRYTDLYLDIEEYIKYRDNDFVTIKNITLLHYGKPKTKDYHLKLIIKKIGIDLYSGEYSLYTDTYDNGFWWYEEQLSLDFEKLSFSELMKQLRKNVGHYLVKKLQMKVELSYDVVYNENNILNAIEQLKQINF